MSSSKWKIKKTVIIEFDEKQALYIKGAFQNCPTEDPNTRKLYEEIFNLFPPFEEI